jgi:hypothetical protein
MEAFSTFSFPGRLNGTRAELDHAADPHAAGDGSSPEVGRWIPATTEERLPDRCG